MNAIFSEITEHLLNDASPSEYFNKISHEPFFDKYPLEMLQKLKSAEQTPKYHPEGNVWNHTMMVLDEAAKVKNKSKNEKIFMWAALLHDIGKPSTTKIRNGKITSYEHDIAGERLAAEFLKEFTSNEQFINGVTSLVRWHMQILFVVKDLPFADIYSMKKQSDVNEIALLGLCDRLGRIGADRRKEEENIRIFLEKCK